MAQLMYKIANEPAPDIRLVRQDLSERLADIVALSLSKTSETRYQDGDQFAADLRAVIAEGSAAPAPASGPGRPAKILPLKKRLLPVPLGIPRQSLPIPI